MKNNKNKSQKAGPKIGKSKRATGVSPFEYVNNINLGKNLIDDDKEYYEPFYNSFIVNKAFSFHLDTILQANEMNKSYHLDSSLQYDYLLSTVRQKRRAGTWLKKSKNDDLSMISEYYKINNNIAQMYLNIMSETDIIKIKKEVNYESRN